MTIISLTSVAGVATIPFLGKKMYKKILAVLVALGVGTLAGDSLLHLLPHVSLNVPVYKHWSGQISFTFNVSWHCPSCQRGRNWLQALKCIICAEQFACFRCDCVNMSLRKCRTVLFKSFFLLLIRSQPCTLIAIKKLMWFRRSHVE